MSYSTHLHLPVKEIGLFLVLSLISLMANAQITVKADDIQYRYALGDTVHFVVLSQQSGPATYTIRKDPVTPILHAGSINLTAGKTDTIDFVPVAHGLYFCQLTQDAIVQSGVALVAANELDALEDEPADFDAYWAGFRAQLDLIDIDQQVTHVKDTTYSTIYKLSLGSINNRRAYAYMVVPNGPGPFTGMIKFPAFGNSAAAQPDISMAERLGAIVISPSIHNTPADVPDPNQYTPDIQVSDTVYYRWAIAAGMRAIDYLETRPDYHPAKYVGTYGVSQGAGLAMLLAGIDQRVDILAFSNSILCQHSGLKYNQPSGFPKYIKDALSDPTETDRILNAVKYYDGIYAAKRFTRPVFFSSSYQDELNSAETVFAATNQFHGAVTQLHHLDGLHSNNPPEYWTGIQNFVVRHFPTSQAPWPWPLTDTGLKAFAGNNQTSNYLQAILSGEIDDNGLINPANIPVKWEVLDGPGEVTFSNQNAHLTTASFSLPGVYTLKFVGEELSLLASDNKYYTASDVVVLDICPLNNCSPLPVELIDFIAEKRESKVRLSWKTATELNNLGFAIEKKLATTDWQEIGFVHGHGTTPTQKAYNFLDGQPSSGANYYRLAQYDFDGRKSYSKIRTVHFDSLSDQFTVSPNPATNSFRVFGNTDSTHLTIYSLTGQLMLSQQLNDNTEIDVSYFPKGNYVLKLLSPDQIITQKLVIR